MDHRPREPVPGRPGRHRQEPPARRARRRRGPGRAQGPLLHRRRAGRDPLPRPGRQLRRPGHRHPAPQRPDHHRRSRVRPARRHRRPAAVPRRRRRLRTPRPRHRQPLALRIQWGRFLPEHTTAVSLLDRLLHHASVVVTDGDSYRMREARAKRRNHPEQDLINPRGGDFYLATSGDHNLAVDSRGILRAGSCRPVAWSAWPRRSATRSATSTWTGSWPAGASAQSRALSACQLAAAAVMLAISLAVSGVQTPHVTVEDVAAIAVLGIIGTGSRTC